jgi:phosphate uptake regulator
MTLGGGDAVGPVTRSVQIAGGSTFVVSLPKDWARTQDIEAGSTLWLYPLEDRVVVAPSPDADAPTEATIDATDLDERALGRRIRAAYAAGFDAIVVRASGGLPDDSRATVRRTVDELVGVETERSDGAVRARSLLDADQISLEQSVVQLRGLTSSMHRDAAEAFETGNAELAALVERREEDVDRLVALVDRQFHAALADVTAVERLDSDRETAYRHDRSARLLGRIAASAVRIATVADEWAGGPPDPVTGACDAARSLEALLGAALGGDPAAVDRHRREVDRHVEKLADGATAAPGEAACRVGRVAECYRRAAGDAETIAAVAAGDRLADDGR